MVCTMFPRWNTERIKKKTAFEVQRFSSNEEVTLVNNSFEEKHTVELQDTM